MIDRLSNELLLRPCDIQPSQGGWEVVGVFNPAIAMVAGRLTMLARVAERPDQQRCRAQRPGWTCLPRWTDGGTATVDWFDDDDLQLTDARVVMLRDRSIVRLTSVSHFQIFRQSAPGSSTWEHAGALLPEGSTEEFGIEDPRITKIDNCYWITYVAVSRWGAATALMSSPDMVTFQRHGIIFASENKDVVLFPQRIAGDFIALHRPNPRAHFSPPQIWIARSPDLIHWGSHQPLHRGAQSWEGDRVGSGTPPILIDEGWLTLYHGSQSSPVAGTVGQYAVGALLLDRDDPSAVIAWSREPIMQPTCDYERNGFVPNVVFPTAMLVDSDDDEAWLVFYGAADTSVAMTRFSKQSVIDSLVSTRELQS